MKKVLLTFLILISFIASAYRKPDTYVIEASKNAYIHNNLGLNYMEEKCYYAAIQEFKIAISINPDTQATAVYYNNIGDAYMKIGYPNLAQKPYEDAINQYSLNLQYYQDLVKCYKALGIIDKKIKEYSNEENALNKVVLGLLYIEKGNTKRGIIILDEFVMSEPHLIITPAVKHYIKNSVNELNAL